MTEREIEQELERMHVEAMAVAEKIKPMLAKHKELTKELEKINSQLDSILRKSDFLEVANYSDEACEWINVWLFEVKYMVPEDWYCKSCGRELWKREENYCSECAKRNAEQAKAKEMANLLAGIQALDELAGKVNDKNQTS